LKTWLSDCRVDPSFQRPTASQRRVWDLPDDWPYRIDKDGGICKSPDCISCLVAWVDDSGVQTQEIHELLAPQIVGILPAQDKDFGENR
jgi:hypothetical protein